MIRLINILGFMLGSIIALLLFYGPLALYG